MVTFLSYIGEQAMISVVHKSDASVGRFGAVQVSHGYLPFIIYVAKIVINFATLPVFCSMRLADASHRESASRFEPICGRKSKKICHMKAIYRNSR